MNEVPTLPILLNPEKNWQLVGELNCPHSETCKLATAMCVDGLLGQVIASLATGKKLAVKLPCKGTATVQTTHYDHLDNGSYIKSNLLFSMTTPET